MIIGLLNIQHYEAQKRLSNSQLILKIFALKSQPFTCCCLLAADDNLEAPHQLLPNGQI